MKKDFIQMDTNSGQINSPIETNQVEMDQADSSKNEGEKQSIKKFLKLYFLLLILTSYIYTITRLPYVMIPGISFSEIQENFMSSLISLIVFTTPIVVGEYFINNQIKESKLSMSSYLMYLIQTSFTFSLSGIVIFMIFPSGDDVTGIVALFLYPVITGFLGFGYSIIRLAILLIKRKRKPNSNPTLVVTLNKLGRKFYFLSALVIIFLTVIALYDHTTQGKYLHFSARDNDPVITAEAVKRQDISYCLYAEHPIVKFCDYDPNPAPGCRPNNRNTKHTCLPTYIANRIENSDWQNIINDPDEIKEFIKKTCSGLEGNVLNACDTIAKVELSQKATSYIEDHLGFFDRVYDDQPIYTVQQEYSYAISYDKDLQAYNSFKLLEQDTQESKEESPELKDYFIAYKFDYPSDLPEEIVDKAKENNVLLKVENNGALKAVFYVDDVFSIGVDKYVSNFKNNTLPMLEVYYESVAKKSVNYGSSSIPRPKFYPTSVPTPTPQVVPGFMTFAEIKALSPNMVWTSTVKIEKDVEFVYKSKKYARTLSGERSYSSQIDIDVVDYVDEMKDGLAENGWVAVGVSNDYPISKMGYIKEKGGVMRYLQFEQVKCEREGNTCLNPNAGHTIFYSDVFE